MKKFLISAFIIFALAHSGVLLAQDANPTIYAESYRRGTTQVTEESFDMKLTPENSTYREVIKDEHGNDRFVFTVAPRTLEGQNEVISWQAKLADLRHSAYDNVFMTAQEPSADAPNNLWRLDPGQYAAVPARARRIVKVDGFYATMQIKVYHFTPLDSPYLDSMTVHVDFKNSDPRAAPAP
jgi:hypothetical protein